MLWPFLEVRRRWMRSSRRSISGWDSPTGRQSSRSPQVEQAVRSLSRLSGCTDEDVDMSRSPVITMPLRAFDPNQAALKRAEYPPVCVPKVAANDAALWIFGANPTTIRRRYPTPSTRHDTTRHDTNHDSAGLPGDRPGSVAELRAQRTTLHLLSDGRPLRRGVRRTRLSELVVQARSRRDRAAPVAVRASPVLRHDLLLLRLQQDRHPGSRSCRQVPALSRARSRVGVGIPRWRPAPLPVALGRWHADVPAARPAPRTDGHYLPALQAGTRWRVFDRDRPAQRRPHLRPERPHTRRLL
jgi:hypothetical protein